MSIRNFFDKQIIVSRLKTVLGNRRNYTTTATVDMALQEMDRQSRGELDIVEDRAWIAYFDIEDKEKVMEQDMLTDSNGIKYKVIDRTLKDYGINQHIEVILVEYLN